MRNKKKLKKFWNKVFKGEELNPPKYCPNCGKKFPADLPHRTPFWNDSSRLETPENPFKEIGYDCYCPNCDWSGDIIPDEDRNVIHNLDSEGKEYLKDGRDWHREDEE